MTNKQHRYTDLIKTLSASTKPEPPFKATKFILAGFLATLIISPIGVWFFHIRPDIAHAIRQPLFYLLFSGLTVSLGCTLIGAIVSGFPGRLNTALRWIIGGLLALTGLILWYVTPSDIFTLDKGYMCTLIVVGLGSIPSILSITMLKKLAPTNPRMTSALSFGAAALSGNVGLYLICPSQNHLHNLVWHLMPILLFAGLGWLVGRRLLRW